MEKRGGKRNELPLRRHPGAMGAAAKESPWLLYILLCSDGSLYTGITNNLARRLARHSAGKASRYTRTRLPVELAWTRPCSSEGDARSLECRVKTLTRAEKLRVIDGCGEI